MQTKIIIDNKQYTVNLLTAKEVIQSIPGNFIYSGVVEKRKYSKLTSSQQDELIYQYIDYYEKIEYEGNNYFILKSDLPLIFMQKSQHYENKLDEINADNIIGSIFFPLSNFYKLFSKGIKNFINLIKIDTLHKPTLKISFKDELKILQIIFFLIFNIGFYYFCYQKNDIYPFLIVAFLNFLLNFVKINFNYLNPSNYKLAPFSFDPKYEKITLTPYNKLLNMKASQPSQINKYNKENDFSFNTKEINS